ncbi:MAG: 30S ribosomal protein S8 [Dehalococcoidia bacterium]|nr:30S ribosomal protein S8 [Dehalococcoidia bacterium]
MAVSDPIADMLTRIRNGAMARHDSVVFPASKMKLSIAKILKQEGYINSYELVGDGTKRNIKIVLKYQERNKPMIIGLKRMSKPGLRLYVQHNEIPRVFGGMGIAILSTSRGVVPSYKAWKQGLGGELLCYVW